MSEWKKVKEPTLKAYEENKFGPTTNDEVRYNGVNEYSPFIGKKAWQGSAVLEQDLPKNDNKDCQIGYWRIENPWQFVHPDLTFKIFRQDPYEPDENISAPRWEVLKSIGNLCNVGLGYLIGICRAILQWVCKAVKTLEGLETKLSNIDTKIDNLKQSFDSDYEKLYHILKRIGKRQGIDVDEDKEYLPDDISLQKARRREELNKILT
ncbi:MAG: hypothetical protein [Grapevine pararetrovirus]|nr:MAG: hypothetical protein [Grapevine pararetrovirus]